MATTAYSPLLGLALPVTGELSGQWGDTVNNYITSYLDAAVAGTQIISGSQTAVTLTVANGAALTQAASASSGSAQYSIIRCSGNPASTLTITAPAASKSYLVINTTSTSQDVKLVGSGPTTGVTIGAGTSALCVWNGSDFIKVSGTGGATGGGSNQIFYENGQTVTVNYSITNGNNAGTFGPVTVDAGVTVTVPTGSTWSIV